MLTETFHSIVTAARKVFTNWRAMLLLAIVYASLLAALYFFLAVREASFMQVVLTFALAESDSSSAKYAATAMTPAPMANAA